MCPASFNVEIKTMTNSFMSEKNIMNSSVGFSCCIQLYMLDCRPKEMFYNSRVINK